MIAYKKSLVASILLLSLGSSLVAYHDEYDYEQESDRDILVEFKGSIFVPSNDLFHDVYGNCGDFGVEITGNLLDRLYAFFSTDFIVKHGLTSELGSASQLNLVNMGVGLKYFVPFKHGDFYVGLGIEPTYLGMRNETLLGLFEQQSWVCGGIAKVGFIVDVGHSFFLDFFVDYSFAKADFNNNAEQNTVYLNGALYGLGFGYRFN